MKKIAIIGSGTWGTALAIHLNNNGNQVTLWSYLEEEAKRINETRKIDNLKDVIIDKNIEVTNDLKKAIVSKDIVIMVVPSKFMRENVKKILPYVSDDQIIINASKGLEENTLKTMTGIIKEELPLNKVATISGPSHAEEVAKLITTTCIIATESKDVAVDLQETFASDTFRVYINPDLLGVELGGSLKNIIALAAGIADGMKLGDNAKAALITRGLVEISRLGVGMGADIRTFYGLSGLGDLIVTCNSMHSRNRRCGIMLGEGKSLDEAKKEINMVVEGVDSAKAGYELAKKHKIDVPIIEAVNRILFDGSNPKEETLNLMRRAKKEEFSDEMNMSINVKWEGVNDNVCR